MRSRCGLGREPQQPFGIGVARGPGGSASGPRRAAGRARASPRWEEVGVSPRPPRGSLRSRSRQRACRRPSPRPAPSRTAPPSAFVGQAGEHERGARTRRAPASRRRARSRGTRRRRRARARRRSARSRRSSGPDPTISSRTSVRGRPDQPAAQRRHARAARPGGPSPRRAARPRGCGAAPAGRRGSASARKRSRSMPGGHDLDPLRRHALEQQARRAPARSSARKRSAAAQHRPPVARARAASGRRRATGSSPTR